MIYRCFNPDCRRELRYLRDGRVVRVIHGKGAQASVEHFWLCGPCYQDHDFRFPAGGSVTIELRVHEQPKEFVLGDVLLAS